MLIAQMQPADFGPWLSNLFYLVGVAAAGVVLIQRLRPQKPRETQITSQPITIKGETEYVPVHRHNELVSRVDSLAVEIRLGFERLDDKRSSNVSELHKELEAVAAAIRKDFKGDVDGLHARITEVLAAVAELKGRIQK